MSCLVPCTNFKVKMGTDVLAAIEEGQYLCLRTGNYVKFEHNGTEIEITPGGWRNFRDGTLYYLNVWRKGCGLEPLTDITEHGKK